MRDAVHHPAARADLWHPPAKITELIVALDVTDVAIGSAYVEGGRVRNCSRRLIS